MIDDLVKLKRVFSEVNSKGWIKSLRDGYTGIGYTFEKMIGKNEDDFSVPDFGSIEIKTKNVNSKEWMTLFNAVPDGDFVYPIKDLYDKYGVPDKNCPKHKIFYAAVFSYPCYANNKYSFKISVDRKKEEIRMFAIDKYGCIEDTDTTWSFKYLEEKLYCKIKYLAIVRVLSRYIHGCFYYKYDSIEFYMLKSFEEFLNLIENGLIKITFKVDYHKSGTNIGKIHNHGTGFDIDVDSIDKLYYRVC